MGVDLHALRFLQYATATSPLGEVATLGRQGVHLDRRAQRKLLSPAPEQPYGPYCEELLLERFGATSVTSFDASNYEGATLIHDMNLPISSNQSRFDTVLDFGTLEHVFNLPVALSNVAGMCKPSGRILHYLPGNNCSGHGFYQFSPELFLSLYSQKNGFSGTQVFVAELADHAHWWRSLAPSNGRRVEYTSDQRSYVLVITCKTASDTHQVVQQSDYEAEWVDANPRPSGQRPSIRNTAYAALRKTPFLWRYADNIARPINLHESSEHYKLSGANTGFCREQINDLIRRRLYEKEN